MADTAIRSSLFATLADLRRRTQEIRGAVTWVVENMDAGDDSTDAWDPAEDLWKQLNDVLEWLNAAIDELQPRFDAGHVDQMLDTEVQRG
jgi:hypothetical protein